MTEIEKLWKQASEIKYPKETMACPREKIKGPAFFPGGTGLIGDQTTISKRSIMILGQDQDNKKGFEKSIRLNYETYSPTWVTLDLLLKAARINKEDCFFTNFIMGIRVNGAKNTGPSPALKCPDFITSCGELMIEQIRLLKPSAIVCLGMAPAILLGQISDQIRIKQNNAKNRKELDERSAQFIPEVAFNTIDHKAAVCVLVHPSYRHMYANNQELEGLSSNDAELRMLALIKERITNR